MKITIILSFCLVTSMLGMNQQENNSSSETQAKKILLISQFPVSKEYMTCLTTALNNLIQSLEAEPLDGYSVINVRELETAILEEYKKKNQ